MKEESQRERGRKEEGHRERERRRRTREEGEERKKAIEYRGIEGGEPEIRGNKGRGP